jgi:hypothetical protein
MNKRTNLVFTIFFLSFFTIGYTFFVHTEYIRKKYSYNRPETENRGVQRDAGINKRIGENEIIKVDDYYKVGPEQLKLEILRFSMESKLWYKNSAALVFPPITLEMNKNIKIYVNTTICTLLNRNNYQIEISVGSVVRNFYGLYFTKSFCNFPDYKELQNAVENENQEYLDYQIKNIDNFDVMFGCSISLPCNTNGFVKITIIRECSVYKYNIEIGGPSLHADW